MKLKSNPRMTDTSCWYYPTRKLSLGGNGGPSKRRAIRRSYTRQEGGTRRMYSGKGRSGHPVPPPCTMQGGQGGTRKRIVAGVRAWDGYNCGADATDFKTILTNYFLSSTGSSSVKFGSQWSVLWILRSHICPHFNAESLVPSIGLRILKLNRKSLVGEAEQEFFWKLRESREVCSSRWMHVVAWAEHVWRSPQKVHGMFDTSLG